MHCADDLAVRALEADHADTRLSYARAVIREDAERFRRLPPRQRWQELFALRAWANRLAASPPQGRRIRELESEAETRWQAIQRELFARHGRAD